MNDGFVGLDPVGCREFAARWEEAALESLALAEEYREIGRVGLMEAEFAVVVWQLTEVHDELQSAVKILRSKSDEVEALERRWLGIADVPKPSSRPTGRYTPKRTGVSGPPPVALAFRAQVGSDSAGPSKPASSSSTSTPKMSSPDAKVKVPAGAKSQVSGTGGKKPVGAPAKPAPTPPKKMGPPAPSSTPNLKVPNAQYWASISDAEVKAGQKVAERIEANGLQLDELPEADRSALACWWYAKQHDDTTPGPSSIWSVQSKMPGRDVALVTELVVLFDSAAYERLVEVVDVERVDEMFAFIQSDEARKLSNEELAKQVKAKFGDTDPIVISATQMYIKYQLLAAHWNFDERMADPDWYGQFGLRTPVVEMRPWAIGAIYGNRDRGLVGLRTIPSTVLRVSDIAINRPLRREGPGRLGSPTH